MTVSILFEVQTTPDEPLHELIRATRERNKANPRPPDG